MNIYSAQIIYDAIVSKAKSENRKKSKNQYFENHHIIPKCLGGSNNKSNLVLLTAKEHFVCHHLLTKIYPNNQKIIFAFWAMCNLENKSTQKRNYKISSSLYEYNKKSISSIMSKLMNKLHKNRTKEQKMKFTQKVIEANQKRIENGTHNFQDCEKQKQKALNRVKNGTHNFLKDSAGNSISKMVQQKLVSEGNHSLQGVVSCFDKQGNFKKISVEMYNSQSGPKEDWEFVHNLSKQGKERRLLHKNN